MNPKQLKRLRKKAREIFLQFIKESLSLEKQANITDEKINFLINNPSYEWHGRTLKLQEWCYRWIIQTLKKYPSFTIEDLKIYVKKY